MKDKTVGFLKALGSVFMAGLLLCVGLVGIIGEIFPAAIPDRVWIGASIVCLPLWVAFFRCVIKEKKRKRQDKRAQKEKSRSSL